MTSRPERLGPETLARLTLDTEPWLSCDDCFRHVDEYAELVLAGAAARMPAMTVHLRGCPACAEEAETVLALAAEDAGLDPDRLVLPD
jgi:hypothetical protein